MDTLSSFWVRLARLELARREAPDPKSGVATNYTTAAIFTAKVSIYFYLQLYRPLVLI